LGLTSQSSEDIEGGEVMMWSYDPVGDVFYAQRDSIFRYAR